MKNYRKRIADDILKRKLEGKGAVLIEGPKWCGKTTTAEQVAASILYMDDPEKKAQNIAMSVVSPKRLLRGAVPRLIVLGTVYDLELIPGHTRLDPE